MECINPDEIKDPYMDLLGQATKCWVDSPEPIYIYTYAHPPPPHDLPFGGLVSLVQVLMTINSF